METKERTHKEILKGISELQKELTFFKSELANCRAKNIELESIIIKHNKALTINKKETK